jgi:hypothetical protein
MPLCCAEGHGMTWKAPHGVQWLTCDRQHCMSGLCDPCKPTYTCSDCDYDMCNVCAEVECAMPSRRTPPVEPVPLTPAADRPPRTPRTKEVPDLMPDPDSDGDDEEMEEEEGEEAEGEEAEAVEKREKKKVFVLHTKKGLRSAGGLKLLKRGLSGRGSNLLKSDRPLTSKDPRVSFPSTTQYLKNSLKWLPQRARCRLCPPLAATRLAWSARPARPVRPPLPVQLRRRYQSHRAVRPWARVVWPAAGAVVASRAARPPVPPGSRVTQHTYSAHNSAHTVHIQCT